ncbi:DNA-binding GntR family transcriptional regulator [Nakamurella flavida]|uniref:GntR family transcriptional regulator n=1 Tax=Nakamurella flavida TaxID=363630 RepID=UPI00278337AA|nr:GntR family transcriptional regulator [Nakamurella flavida]MDP9778504.1 DNA-binding GntR family transcriptional regulator [Nakamurella flavida]
MSVSEPSGLETPTSPVAHLSLPESVHRILRRRILNNELGSGTRLVEANLALELGVSRSTVRQALVQLSQEGLVEISPRRHSVVTRMSYAEIDDACYARFVLEEGALRAVADDRLTVLADELDEVAGSMAQAAAAGDLAALVDLDTQFHGCILRESGKQRLAHLWGMLNGQMGALMRSSMEDQRIDLAEAERRHLGLAEVVRRSDRAEISAKLWEHYLRRPADPGD